jgi:hypothetical protein
MGTVKRREWAWVIVVAAVIVVASTLPYLTGYLAQTPQWRFGGSLMDVVDYNSYLAKMRQGYEGAWRYRLAFTTEPHQGAYLVTIYLALGHVAHLARLSLPFTYQLARVVFGFLMLLAVYRFIALLVEPVRTRRVAFLLASIASGLGWLTQSFAQTLPGGVSPLEFWLLDAYTYLAILIIPHFSAAIALLLGILILLLKRAHGPSLLDAGLAVLASLALGLIHPYALLLADLVPLLYWGVEWLRTRQINWRGATTVVMMGITQLPILVYDFGVFRTQPVFASWSAQNVTLSPPLQTYLWGYGTLLVLGIIGSVVWARQGWPGLAIPLIWIGLVAILTQLPWNIQRRFLEGVQVPLGLLAGVGVAQGLFPGHHRPGSVRWRWLAMASLIAFLAMSNLYLTLGYSVATATRSAELFWPADVLSAVDWLGEHTLPEDTVLSSFEVGNLIPARIGHRVVWGHWMETVDYEAKKEAVYRFFDGAASAAERLALLERYGAEYVFYGPQEQAMGAFDPAGIDYLVPVFGKGDVRIYRVVHSAAQGNVDNRHLFGSPAGR